MINIGKLYYKYSCMGAGKSIDLLKTAYNYEERKQSVLLLTSATDNRYETGKITTRIGLQKDALAIHKEDNIIEIYNHLSDKPNIILCDEIQFFQPYHIEQLAEIVDKTSTPIICYGIRTDFQSKTFPASKRLLELADCIEELKTMCWCGKKAIINARIINGEVVTEGNQVQIGGNESYIALCRKHWKEKNLGDENK